MIPVTCGDYARVLFTFAREAAGALGTGIPCALYFLGERFLQDSDASRREIAESWLTSLRGAKRRSNPLFFSATHGLLRGACHRARVRATRWLAMTIRTVLAV